MRVQIGRDGTHQGIIDYCGYTYGVDLVDFADTLSSLKHFETCQIETSWGLLILEWHRLGEKAVNSVFLDVLQLTQGTVIDDDTGQIVSRWQRLADQLEKDAEEKAVPDGLYVPPSFRKH